VFTANGEAHVAELVATVGIAVRNVHVHRPTLDDVFLHYTGREIRESHTERQPSARMRAIRARR
jgi:ABC-2 type transport system ATP-binding protein